MYSGFVGHGNVFLADFYNFLAPTRWLVPTRVELGNFFSLFRPGTQAGLFFHGIDRQWTRPQIHHSGQTLRPSPPTPLLLPRLVNACLATVCGYGPTCGGVLFSFSPLTLFEKRRLLLPLPSPNSRHMSLVNFMSATIQHYRREYPTEGISQLRGYLRRERVPKHRDKSIANLRESLVVQSTSWAQTQEHPE